MTSQVSGWMADSCGEEAKVNALHTLSLASLSLFLSLSLSLSLSC
jgi:hypothetical protein